MLGGRVPLDVAQGRATAAAAVAGNRQSSGPAAVGPAPQATLEIVRLIAATACLLILLQPAGAQAPRPLREAVERLTAEAGKFLAQAPSLIGRERLVQLRADRPQRTAQRHEVVSDYGFVGPVAGGVWLLEYRRVASAGGKPVKRREDSLQLLARRLISNSDKERRRMMEELEKHGLRGVVTDFGQILLLFAPGRAETFELQFARKGQHLGRDVVVFTFQQVDGPDTMTIYENGKAIRRPMKGEVWVRAADYLPVRVLLSTERQQDGARIRDATAVDYAESRFGTLLPSHILHQQTMNGRLVVQDEFQYTDFRPADELGEISGKSRSR